MIIEYFGVVVETLTKVVQGQAGARRRRRVPSAESENETTSRKAATPDSAALLGVITPFQDPIK